MARKNSGVGKTKDAVQKSEAPIAALRDEELIAVAGGFGALQSSFSNVIKNLGEAMNAMARKQ